MNRDLRIAPLWRKEELGMPIPASKHACSVCLPTWQSVLDYEEGRDKVMRSLQSGYPRFILAPDIVALNSKLKHTYGLKDQEVMVFSSRESAQRAQRFLELVDYVALEIKSYKGAYVLVYPNRLQEKARLFWRYSGEGITSRQAYSILRGDLNTKPNIEVRKKIASIFNILPSYLHLWQSGMAAIFVTHRFATRYRIGKKTLQVDFPYVDSLRVQQVFGSGVVFLPRSQGEDLHIALERIRMREFSAVYAEIASNPLLYTPAIKELSEACRVSQTPFIVDDTVSTHYNVGVLSYADVVTTSLTKWVSGKGDVLAGSTRINPDSFFAQELTEYFDAQTNELGSALYSADEDVLLNNARGFSDRMPTINSNGKEIAEFLNNHSLVKKVYYPLFTNKDEYDSYLTKKGGYGGLLSIVLKNSKKTPLFYDFLELTKGPSLGTDFTLVCPYTLLAHYDELEWAQENGVHQHLIRISVGIEPLDHLLAIFEKAFSAIQ